MKLKLELPKNLAPYLTLLAKARTAVVGLVLVGIFGYTAFIVNNASNIKSDQTSGTDTVKITFDKSALAAVKKRTQVSDQTSLGNLGKSDPFAH